VAVSIALSDALVWATWSVLVGLAVHVAPRRWYDRDTWLTRTRTWERRGHVYERVRIRRWKNRLPEVGGKRTLPPSLDSFAAETRRAEYVHWAIASIAPAFALWNPWWLTTAMVAYAVGANAPFIAVQRYNRARVVRIAQCRARVRAS
jgi:glycosyl-4,4'-diaponeurosporenoate acyltransferase